MNSLSTVLSNISNGVTATGQPENISATLQHGLIKAGGKMTTAQMIAASQPREQALTSERAQRAWQFLRRLKSSRKTVREWNNKTLMIRTGYDLPEGMTKEQATKGLIECLRPVSPTITAHFVKLHACKPMFDPDEERIGIVFDALYNDLRDFPEVAVIVALDEMRTMPGKYFPTTYEIVREVSEYRDTIYIALDFFQGDLS